MADKEIFVEFRNGSYVTLEGGRAICTASTQAEAGERAHRLRPAATIFGERVRTTTVGGRDKWRVLHHPQS